MAKLANKMKKLVRGPGGQLSYQTGETVNKAASRLGMPSAPITAQGAAGLTSNPDQLKMQGTPAQKLKAFDMSNQRTAQDFLRTKQDRTQMNQGEQQQAEKGEQLEQLGAMGDRIQGMLNAELGALQQAQDQQLQVQEDLSGAQLAEGFTEDQLRQSLEAFAAGDQNQLVAINQALGKTPGEPLTVEELDQLFGEVDAQTALAIANAAPDAILVDEALAQDLGFDSMDTLADLLGVTPEELSAMNVNQMDETVQAILADEFNQVEALRARANNPNISAAERAAIGNQLRALGATGVRATEEEVADLAQELATAEVVTIGGQQVTIEEALSDETISAIVKDYLLDPESKAAESLPDEFKEFIDRNRAALEDAAGELDEDTAQFAEIQAENLAIGDTEGGQIDDKVLETILGEGWKDEFRTEGIDVSEWPGFALLESDALDQAEKSEMVGSLNQLADYNEELAAQVMQLSEQELSDLGIIAPAGSPANKQWKQYLRQLDTAKRLKRVNPKDTDAVLNALIPGVNAKEFRQQWDQAGLRKELGFGSKLFDKYRSVFGGKQIDSKRLYSKMRNPAQLDDLKNYRKTLMTEFSSSFAQDLKSANDENKTWKAVRSTLFDKKLDRNEANKVFETLMNNPELGGFEAAQKLYSQLKGRADGAANLGKRMKDHINYWEGHIQKSELGDYGKVLDHWDALQAHNRAIQEARQLGYSRPEDYPGYIRTKQELDKYPLGTMRKLHKQFQNERDAMNQKLENWGADGGTALAGRRILKKFDKIFDYFG